MVNDKYYNIFQYIVLILIILQCNSVFAGMHNMISFMLSSLCFVFIFLLSIITLIKFKIDKYSYFKLSVTFMIMTMLTIIFVFSEYVFIYEYKIENVFLWLISIPVMTVFFYITVIYNEILKSFFEKLFTVIFMLSSISLLFLGIYNLGIPTNTSLSSGWTGNIDGYYYLFFVYQKGSIFGLRNSSIFTEPNVYGFVLITALLVYFFILRKDIKDHPIKLLIICFTIVTTNSSNAIIIAVIIFIFYFIQKNNIITNFCLVPILFIGYYIIVILYSAKKSVNIYSSYAIRLDDIQACFHAWLDGNLLFGNGFDNFSNIFKYVYSYRAFSGVLGLSSGFFWMLVSGGVFLMLFSLLPSILVVFKSIRLFLVALVINIYSIYGIVNETYLFTMFLALFWAVIICQRQNNNRYKE